MNDAAVDEFGSVDYLVVDFPADNADFLGAMAAELSALVGRGVVRVLDLLILKRDLDGSVEVSRYPGQLPQSLLQALGEHSLTIDRLSDRYV